ncbi:MULTISPECIES: hypothetical protein [unclassified Streptomyces]|uniref:hypothetical protein n=1 Tax=unclassified Streptomyces TaxID=2593676 RepID=UPI00278C365A|nr:MULTISPECIES: hypothetical protein [unclassified Streptomyces]
MTAYRRATTVAVAVLLTSGLTAPVALAATPERAPAASTQAPADTTVVSDGLLRLDLAAALDLDAHGVSVAAVGGAAAAADVSSIDADAGVVLSVASGSNIQHDHGRLTGGTINLAGGLQLRKADRTVAITNLRVDVRTGVVHARVGAQGNVAIGSVDLSDAEVVQSHEGSTRAVLNLGGGSMRLNSAVVSRIDADLGTSLAADVDLDAGVDVDADLAAEVNVDAGLAAVLDIDLDALLDLDVGLGIHLL